MDYKKMNDAASEYARYNFEHAFWSGAEAAFRRGVEWAEQNRKAEEPKAPKFTHPEDLE